MDAPVALRQTFCIMESDYIIEGSERYVNRHEAGFGDLFKTDAFKKAFG